MAVFSLNIAFLEYQYKETEKFNKIISSHNQEITRGKIKTEYVEDGLGLHIREEELSKF